MKKPRDRRRPEPRHCSGCAGACRSPIDRPAHTDCRKAAAAKKRRDRPR